MATKYCDENHYWGPVFDSGNIYCKHCGSLLGNIYVDGKIPGIMEIKNPRYNYKLTGIISEAVAQIEHAHPDIKKALDTLLYDDGKGAGAKEVVMDHYAPSGLAIPTNVEGCDD